MTKTRNSLRARILLATIIGLLLGVALPATIASAAPTERDPGRWDAAVFVHDLEVDLTDIEGWFDDNEYAQHDYSGPNHPGSWYFDPETGQRRTTDTYSDYLDYIKRVWYPSTQADHWYDPHRTDFVQVKHAFRQDPKVSHSYGDENVITQCLDDEVFAIVEWSIGLGWHETPPDDWQGDPAEFVGHDSLYRGWVDGNATIRIRAELFETDEIFGSGGACAAARCAAGSHVVNGLYANEWCEELGGSIEPHVRSVEVEVVEQVPFPTLAPEGPDQWISAPPVTHSIDLQIADHALASVHLSTQAFRGLRPVTSSTYVAPTTAPPPADDSEPDVLVPEDLEVDCETAPAASDECVDEELCILGADGRECDRPADPWIHGRNAPELIEIDPLPDSDVEMPEGLEPDCDVGGAAIPECLDDSCVLTQGSVECTEADDLPRILPPRGPYPLDPVEGSSDDGVPTPWWIFWMYMAR